MGKMRKINHQGTLLKYLNEGLKDDEVGYDVVGWWKVHDPQSLRVAIWVVMCWSCLLIQLG